MTAYLISYDLTGPVRDYEKLIAHLETYPEHSHVLKSTWLVVSSKSAKELRDVMEKYIDSDDKLLVIRVTKGAAWRRLGTKVGNWIKEHV